MEASGFWEHVLRIVRTRLFDIAGTPVSVATMVTVVLILVATAVLSGLIQAAVRRAFRARGIENEGSLGAVTRLLHYAVLLVGFGVALQTVGIDLGALFAAGAIFAVGIGFAMQSIAQNFVSGVILLVERAIKPGDVLEVEGRVVKVLALGIRATIAKTLDGGDLIIPNSTLIQSTVKNYTLQDSLHRVKTPVGVVYGSDMNLVRATLERVAQEINTKWGVENHPPGVLMTGFGDNSVNFVVSIWMNDPWRARMAISELHEAVWWAFKEAGIVIAFPQLDVHFDSEVAGGLAEIKSLKMLTGGAGKASDLRGAE